MRFGTGADVAGAVGPASTMFADMIRFRVPDDLFLPQTFELIDRILTTNANAVNKRSFFGTGSEMKSVPGAVAARACPRRLDPLECGDRSLPPPVLTPGTTQVVLRGVFYPRYS